MLTYQDLLLVGEDEKSRAAFVRRVIDEHKSSDMYMTACTAEDYATGRNTTIMRHKKMLATVTGQMVEDRYSANHKTASNFFEILVTQLNQYLLGNGATWKGATPKQFGEDFDNKLQKAGEEALKGGVSFGMFNLDHIDVFSIREFAPIYDEEDGSLKSGVRFWQIDSTKPLRATLYEMDGYTNYMWTSRKEASEGWMVIEDGIYKRDKQNYVLKTITSVADGTKVYDGANYPTFPVVPLWGNPKHQSELVGLREKIDAYDFIQNGFENDLDNAQIYWIIKGAGGMDDPDLMRFLDRLRTVGAAAPADGQEVAPVAVNIPYEAREKLLDRVERQMYKDSMIMNPDDIAAGAATATQIRAAYERQNVKTDRFEYGVLDFIKGLSNVAGVKSKASFSRSAVVNTQEEITTVVASATYLDPEYVTRKILTLLGDGDQADEMIKKMTEEEAERNLGGDGDNDDTEGQATNQNADEESEQQ